MFVCLHSWLVLSPYPGVPLFICNTGAVWHISAKAKEASCPTGSAFFRITEEFLLSSLKHAVKHFLLTGLPCPNDRFPHRERDLNCLALFIPANVPQTGPQLRKLIRHRQSLNANESVHVCEAPCGRSSLRMTASSLIHPFAQLWCRQESQADSKRTEAVTLQ